MDSNSTNSHEFSSPLSTSSVVFSNEKFSYPSSTSNQKAREKKTVSFPFGKCRICYDNATGVHYGVITCEGCKGFFKRSISQGVPYRCFFGDQCVINMETRNRCKACRFKRCLSQGMAIESVKMGRIPKKLKEKALRDFEQQQKQCQNTESIDSINEETHEILQNTDSIASSSSSPMYLETIQNVSNDENDKIIVIPPEMFQVDEQPFRTVDLVQLTISSSSNQSIENLNENLSSLRLPDIFYQSNSSSFPNENRRASETKASSALVESTRSDEKLTVLKYIWQLNENPLIDYMFGCEIRYAKNVLPIMKYLSKKISQPFFIYELDFEVSSFFRYIRWKMLNFYLKHTRRVQIAVERMNGIRSLGITDYPGMNAAPEQVWRSVQSSIATHVNELIAFARDTPGLNELNRSDFNHILNNRFFDFWTGESYVITDNGFIYSRRFMSQFIGEKTTDGFHELSEALHKLQLTHVEHSLLLPISICAVDTQLDDPDSVHIIRMSYMYALYIQLSATRTEDEAKFIFDQIVECLDRLPALSELCKKTIGELALDKSATRG